MKKRYTSYVKFKKEIENFQKKRTSFTILGREGVEKADWVLLDACDVIVHLFKPEVREFYGLERMWSASANDESIQVSVD